MKLIAETHDAEYCLVVKGNDGTVLATAAAESGPFPPKKFFIWEEEGPDDEGTSEEYEGESAVQAWTVKEGQQPEAVWEQIVEFETYRVAMAVWNRLRDQEEREQRFAKYISECEERFLPNLERYLGIHFDLEAADIDAEILGQVQAIRNHLKEAHDIADLLFDPPRE